MDIHQRYGRQQGSALIESLLAIVVFSIGMISMLMLLSAAMIESGNARYRSEASLLASDLVGRMWSGDRSLTSLRRRFVQSDADEFLQWQQRVESTLPGTRVAGNQPQLTISDDRDVTITLGWQVPGEIDAHQLVISTRITD